MDDIPPPLVTDIRRIRIRRLKAGSLFKLVLLSSASVWIPFFVLCGVTALYGAKTVTFMGNSVVGVTGLVTALIMGPFFALFFAVVGWIGAYVGIRIFGYFSPITIEYVPAAE